MDYIKISQKLNSDGVVHIPNLLNQLKLSLLEQAISDNISNPGPMHKKIAEDANSWFFNDFYNWRRINKIKQIAWDPTIVDLVCRVTNSKHCWFFHDHIIAKKGRAKATPWHHDRPYYIVKGPKNLSVWITPDYIPRNSSLLFLRASHLNKTLYTPRSFLTDENIGENKNFSPLEQETIESYTLLDFEMHPGDALIFFNTTLHSSRPHQHNQKRRALSLRYLLDGAKLTKQYINATPPFDRFGVSVSENASIPETFFPILK